MRTQRRIAVAALASLAACVQPTDVANGGGLSLQIERDAAVGTLDSGYVLVRGPTNTTMKVTPGATVSIEGLTPGTYAVAIEGFDSGGVSRFFQTTGVQVVANQSTALAPTMTQFASFVPAMSGLPSSGTSMTFTVSYDSVAGAASYEVEAATDDAFTTNRVAVSATHTSAAVTVANPGTYYVRVRAIDMYQGRGRPSAPQRIEISSLPTIFLATTTIDFDAVQGRASPAPQTVAVSNGGGGTLSGLSATVSYTTGSGWLSTSLSSTTAPSTLTLTATTSGLAAGTYTATVSVTSAGASNSPQTVSVTFTVAAPPPTIVLARTSVTFSATVLGGDPAPQTVPVTNGGGGTLSGLSATVSYGTGSGWLSASLSSTTAPSTLTLTANTGVLLPGTYTATVAVASTAASNSPQTVNVTLNAGP